VTDGPYLEARDFVSRLFILDCESEARALEIAAEYPFADVAPAVRPAVFFERV